MMQEFSKGLLEKLQTELMEVRVGTLLPHARLRDQLALIREAIGKLRAYVREHPFDSEDQEISYYKQILPAFKSEMIYQVEIYNLQSDAPSGVTDLSEYYRQSFASQMAFLNQFWFYYRYFKLKAEELDSLFFTADGGARSALVPVLAESEEYGTAVGYLFAKFKAIDRLQEFVRQKSEELSAVGYRAAASGKNTPRPAFKWTGKIIDLIEVAHALYLSDEVNNGNAGVVDFFKAFGDFFGVDLGIPKKGMDNLMDRKTIGRTRFLDKIRSCMHERMDELLAYDPDRMRRKMGI
ncbi:RteC domain-containing protein [Pedobacter deserti]|uniref:RteC domain-containing protein n=1 Tax=Pedobacter deserti TaxID=2817382 RepID=UPI00210E1043|nr:RteC domain-containing protein [Pedobacter sp. SYSU D00382]